MVIGRREVDTCVAEQEVDVEEGGATLEEERGRRVGGMMEVGRYNGDDDDCGAEDEVEEDVDVEDVDADG